MSRDVAEATAHITDEAIRSVVEHYDDPDHPDALTVDEVRRLLDDLQQDLTAEWSGLVASIRDGRIDVIADTGGVVVFADGERRRWKQLLDDAGVADRVARTVLRVSHYQAGRRLADADLQGIDPIVVRKPDSAEAGQQFVEAVVDSMLRAGVRPGAAWAYYGVDVRGHSGREWADRCGCDDPLSVADAVETARDTLGE